jgi:hypothetical protein
MNNIEVMLAELAEKLGTTIEHLWGVLLYQSFIFGISASFISMIMLAILIGTFYYLKKVGNERRKKVDWECEYDVDFLTIGWVFFTIIAIVFPIVILVTFYEIFTAFFNPEYWALQTILKHC